MKIIVICFAILFSQYTFAGTYYCEVKNRSTPDSWPVDFIEAKTVTDEIRSIDYVSHFPNEDGTFKQVVETIFETTFRFGFEVSNCNLNLNRVSPTGLVSMRSLCFVKDSQNRLNFNVKLRPEQEGSATLEIREQGSRNMIYRSISVSPCIITDCMELEES